MTKAEWNRIAYYKRAKAWKEAGLCYGCGGIPESPRRSCNKCRWYHKQQYHKHIEDRRKRYRLQRLRERGAIITRSELDNLLDNAKCNICGLTCPIQIDHCHKTGRVRGTLCKTCNSLIGYAKESIEILTSAITYLNKHGVDNGKFSNE